MNYLSKYSLIICRNTHELFVEILMNYLSKYSLIICRNIFQKCKKTKSKFTNTFQNKKKI